MRLPFRRRPTASRAGHRDTSPKPAPAWISAAPAPATLAPVPVTARAHGFVDGLAARKRVGIARAGLMHEVALGGPAGLAAGLVAPAPAERERSSRILSPRRPTRLSFESEPGARSRGVPARRRCRRPCRSARAPPPSRRLCLRMRPIRGETSSSLPGSFDRRPTPSRPRPRRGSSGPALGRVGASCTPSSDRGAARPPPRPRSEPSTTRSLLRPSPCERRSSSVSASISRT